MINRWFEDVKEVVSDPSGFFQDADQDGFGYPLKFAAVSLLVSGVLNAVRTALFSGMGQESGAVAAGAVFGFIGTFIGGLISLLIGAGLIHIVVVLFGGEGYDKTLSVMEYATAVSPVTALLSFVPILGALAGLLVGLYGLYIQIKGVEIIQDLTTGKAAIAVILPGLIIAALVMVLVFTVGAAMLLGGTAAM
ncbi:MAG: Yip1 family protein [Candidatus Nanohalobium sp.]